MNTTSRARAAVAIGLIGAFALTACGGTTPENDDAAEPIEAGSLEELIAAAQEEGQLVWYQTADQRIGDRLAEAFSEEYDINVSFNRLNSSQLEQRFGAEMEAGTPAADLILPIRSEFFDSSMEAGWLVPLPDAGLPEYPPSTLPEQAILDDIGSAVVNITPYAFAYNSDLVSEDEAPETWEDLLDPRWNGQMLMSDPTISSVYTQLYYLVEQEYGLDYLEQLGQMDTRIYQGAAPMVEALAAGEGQIAVPLPIEAIANLRDSTNAPLAWKTMDVDIGAASVIGLVEGAAHPNAARLFAHWLMSEEALEIFASQEGPINPNDVDLWPQELAGPQLAEQAGARQDDIYAALGF